MRPVSTFHATPVVLALLLAGAQVWAGPVSADSPDVPAESARPALPTTLATPVGALSQGSAVIGAAPAFAGNADATPSPSALASEMIKEAGAGTQAQELPRSDRRAGAQPVAPPAAALAVTRAQARVADDESPLREAGKSAVHWLKETIPWLRSDADESGARKNTTLDSADWSTSPLDSSSAGRGARAGQMQAPETSGTAVLDSAARVVYGNAARAKGFDADQNVLGVVFKTLREVLEHPMAWLVVSLIVIGALVVKKIDRRPK